MNETTPTPQPTEAKSNNTGLIAIAAIALLIAGGGIVFAKKIKHKLSSMMGAQPATPSASSTPTTSTVTTSSSSPSPSAMVAYKDGTYTAEGNYMVHIGPEKIKVTVTIKNNIITDTSAENEAVHPVSVKYQDTFIQNYKTMVIGKNINEVHLGKVSSSSLTPQGFNDALQKIEAQAKS